MTQISVEQDCITLINVFTVSPAQQQRLIEVLVTATEDVIRAMPGFVSANIHRSTDGTRVTNYAQWRSQADFEAMLRHPDTAEHLREAGEIATRFEPHFYMVVSVDEAPAGKRSLT